jgi:hypothetical protein
MGVLVNQYKEEHYKIKKLIYWLINMIDAFITEAKKLIPTELKRKLQSKEFRENLLKLHGEKAFLDPNNLKYPIYDEHGFNCGLCYAAYLRTKQNNFSDINIKSIKKLFEKNNCEQSLSIHIGEGQEMDFITFIDLFEVKLDEFDFIECV